MNYDLAIDFSKRLITVNADTLGMPITMTMTDAKELVMDYVNRHTEGLDELRIIESHQFDDDQFMFEIAYKIH